MRIIHVNESFSPLSETSIYSLVTGLQKAGHESYVFTLRRVLESERPYSSVRVLSLPCKMHPNRVIPSLYRRMGLIEIQEQAFFLARNQLSAFAREVKPDIVHAHFGPMGVLVRPIAERLKLPYVVFFGGYDITRLPRNPRWRHHYHELAQSASAVICNSNFTAMRLQELGFDTKRIIRAIGIDMEQLPLIDPCYNFDGQNVNCIFIGRLVDVKNPIPLIAAAAIARRELYPSRDLHLFIVGDGPLRSKVQDYIRQGQHMDYIHLLGSMSHKETMNLLRQMHIYTQYNHRTREGEEETLGGSLLEASASGLPVVAVRSGGVPEAIQDGKTGYLVEENDIQGMAARIVQLAQNPALWTQFGRAGRAHVEANFTLEKQLNKTIELYQSLLK